MSLKLVKYRVNIITYGSSFMQNLCITMLNIVKSRVDLYNYQL